MTSKMRGRPATETVWREAAQLQGNVRQRFYASRGGYSLHVLVVRDPISRANDVSRVWGRLEDPTNHWFTAAEMWWHRVTDTSLEAQIAVAKRWAEKEADRRVRA